MSTRLRAVYCHNLVERQLVARLTLPPAGDKVAVALELEAVFGLGLGQGRFDDGLHGFRAGGVEGHEEVLAAGAVVGCRQRAAVRRRDGARAGAVVVARGWCGSGAAGTCWPKASARRWARWADLRNAALSWRAGRIRVGKRSLRLGRSAMCRPL